MARCLLIACGCRGAALGSALRERGHAVRATSRDPQRLAVLEQLGFEAVQADPDRVATLARALDHVSVAYVLLGSARAGAEALAALHSTRLDMLLTKMLDSTVRGIVYETAGGIPQAVLAEGARRVRAFCEDSRIPYALLGAAPHDADGWIGSAAEAVDGVLAPARR
jgi:nucleoside-diphosphate-sugar epimerase